MTDPLAALPPEIVLQIIDHVPPSTVAALTRLSRTWHAFIDDTHQDIIYASRSKVDRPADCRDLSFVADLNCFTNYYAQHHHNNNAANDDGEGDDNAARPRSWKDLCRRQTLLRANLASSTPSTTDAVIRVDVAKVWRFRADFRRRFFVSTSEFGGLNVTDMDTRAELFGLEDVRDHAHLEYDERTGTAVWDAEGDVLEVWRVVEDADADASDEGKDQEEKEEDEDTRGRFRCIARLHHDCQIRGFEISHGDLAVVSSDGKAFIYALDDDDSDIRLNREIAIHPGAVGHVCQGPDEVIISMGAPGFHVHRKSTGERLGVLDPRRCSRVGHIKHVSAGRLRYEGSDISSQRSGSIHRSARTTQRLAPLRVDRGPLPAERRPSAPTAMLWANNHHYHHHHHDLHAQHHDARHDDDDDGDEWGAALVDGDSMAAISQLGRLFLCPDWRRALQRDEYDAPRSTIVECQVNPRVFHKGGWLALRDGRVAVEVGECVYLLSVGEACNVPDEKTAQPEEETETESESKPICCWAMLSGSDARVLPVPVSFMAMGHDCFMHTYATHCRLLAMGHDVVAPMKTIRVVSFAPDLECR